MSDRIKFEMEFPIKVSQKLLFQYISTPSGLSEWFADNVNSRGEIFIFIWDDSEESAKLLRKNNNCLLYTSPSPRDRQKSRMPSSA